MAKRCFRLKKNKEIEKVFKCGKRAFSQTITLVYFPAKETQYAVCVGKKYGKSVERNRIKRLLREAFAEYGHQIKPCRALLIPKIAKEYEFSLFKRDLKKIIEKEKLLCEG
ncbi:MAG: ribonuclease P protein component [Clostridia bacterium]|nr:ribonuclease P protein component [Clostridia bacterium]